MTGVRRSATQSAVDLPETHLQMSHKALPKPRIRKELLRTTSSDDSDVNFATEKRKPSRFGRLLRRSLSLINTTSSGKVPIQRTITSNPDTPKEVTSVSSSSHEESSNSESDTEEITNAFFFSTTPDESSFITAQDRETPERARQRCTVRAVKVSRVHSQKTPHIRYAANKLSKGEYKSCPLQSKDYKQRRSSPLAAVPTASNETNHDTPCIPIPKGTSVMGKDCYCYHSAISISCHQISSDVARAPRSNPNA